jgi:small-conductance mechanosensitive channel
MWAAQFNAWLPGLLATLLILLASLILASLARRAVRLATARRSVSAQVAPLLSSLAYWAILLTGLTVSLQQVGVNITAIVAGLGIAGFTLGFALQDVSKNFVSGVLLLLERPFRIGEAVELSGFSGTVSKVDLRATEIHTFDGRVVVIPNADVFTKPITNLTRTGSRRVELKLAVLAGSDVEQVRASALNALQGITGLLNEPPPQVLFEHIGSGAIDLLIYYWIDTHQIDPAAAKDQGLVNILAAFRQAGIELPGALLPPFMFPPVSPR